MPSIYFAKSNRCDKKLIASVREYLLDLDLDVKEFTGGTYSNKTLLESDWLIVLPEELGQQTKVGKGLYGQINEFQRAKSETKILIIREIRYVTQMGERRIVDIDIAGYSRSLIMDLDDWINHGIVETFSKTESIDFLRRYSVQEKSLIHTLSSPEQRRRMSEEGRTEPKKEVAIEPKKSITTRYAPCKAESSKDDEEPSLLLLC